MIYFLNVINVIMNKDHLSSVSLLVGGGSAIGSALRFTKIPMCTELKYDICVIIEIRKKYAT